jgi:hypothetical protein
MGHTVASQRMMVDIILGELEAYGKALREEDRVVYNELLKSSLKKVGAISYTSSVNAWAFILISIILEQEKRIRQYESMVNGCVSEGEQDNPVDQDS